MFSPLSLRICCLAAMAPALSNEKSGSENSNPVPQLANIAEGREPRRRGRPRKTPLAGHCVLSMSVAKTGVSLKSVLTSSNLKVAVPKPGDSYRERYFEATQANPIECAKMSSTEGTSKTAKHENTKYLNNKPSKGTKSLGVVKNNRSTTSKASTIPESTNGTNALQQVKQKQPSEPQSDDLSEVQTSDRNKPNDASQMQSCEPCEVSKPNHTNDVSKMQTSDVSAPIESSKTQSCRVGKPNHSNEVSKMQTSDVSKPSDSSKTQSSEVVSKPNHSSEVSKIQAIEKSDHLSDRTETEVYKNSKSVNLSTIEGSETHELHDTSEKPQSEINKLNDKPSGTKSGKELQEKASEKRETSSQERKEIKIENTAVEGDHMPSTSRSKLQPLVYPAKKSKELLEVESSTRQKDLETKAECLYKRLRRLQSRQGISHVKSQLSGLVDHQRKHPQTFSKNSSIDIKEAKDLSTSALVDLVQVWQSRKPPASKNNNNHHSGQGDQKMLDETVCAELSRVSGHLSTNLRQLQRSLDSDATESSSGGESADEADYDYDWCEVSKPAINKRAGWKWAKERAEIASRWTWLQAQVSDLEYRIRQQNEIYKQIRQTKGNVELAEPVNPISVESILKLGNLPKEVEEKLLELQQRNEASPANLSSLLSNLDKQSASISKCLANVFTPLSESPVISPPSGSNLNLTVKGNSTPNGLLNSSGHSSCSTLTATPGSTTTEHFESNNLIATTTSLSSFTRPTVDMENQAARCRPLRTEVYRKRKLLRTSSSSGLHLHSRKAARLSDVRCQCYPPVTPCAMCSGRYNHTEQVSGGDSEPVQVPERIALLDHSYHQVLSFEEDVPLSIHFEGMLKTGAWQRYSSSRSGRTFHLEKRKGQYQIKEKKGCNKRVPPKSASAAVLSRIKNKYEVTRALSSLQQSPDKKRLSADLRLKKKKAAFHAIDGSRKVRGRMGTRSQSDSSLHHRDTPSPNSSHGRESSTMRDLRELMRRKQTESAYDINNIVIPYSIAASTRVEKLQYKEIVTPRWREVSILKQAEDEKQKVPAESPLPAAAVDHQVNKPEDGVDRTKAKSVIQETVKKEEVSAAEKKIQTDSEQSVPSEENEDTDELEDMSDEAYALRHHCNEIDEKKKFAFHPPSQRRRSRPSRAESESIALPESLSPGGGGVVSANASNSSTANFRYRSDSNVSSAERGENRSPASPPAAATSLNNSMRKSISEDNTEEHNGNNKQWCVTPGDGGTIRIRTSSVSSNYSVSRSGNRLRSLSHSEERGGLYPEDSGNLGVAPLWPERTFPLNDDDYNLLFEEEKPAKYSFRNHTYGSGSRPVHIERGLNNSMASSARLGYYLEDEDEIEGELDNLHSNSHHRVSAERTLHGDCEPSRRRNVISPSGSSTSTISDGTEDQNDPEWTVRKVSSRKAGLVLKIAKR